MYNHLSFRIVVELARLVDKWDVSCNSKDFDQNTSKNGITIYLDGETCGRNIAWDIHFQASIPAAPHYWESRKIRRTTNGNRVEMGST